MGNQEDILDFLNEHGGWCSCRFVCTKLSLSYGSTKRKLRKLKKFSFVISKSMIFENEYSTFYKVKEE